MLGKRNTRGEKSKNLNGHRNVENEPTIVCLTEKRELLSVLLKKEFVSAIYLDFVAYGRTHFIDELAEDVAKIKKAKKQAFFAMPRIFRNKIADWFVSLANDLQNLQLDGKMNLIGLKLVLNITIQLIIFIIKHGE